MKTTLRLALWGLLASQLTYSQKPFENCPYKFEIASDYLRDFGFASHEMVAEIRESIRHCDENIPSANYALGMLGRFYAESEQDKEAAFDRIERAALQGHATAAKTLALMLKEGEGCIMNLEASEDWLKKAHKLGDSEAAYILGYYYLKGLGSIRQSYNKAVRWFKKSHYPMAKHWLALCQHEGFGETQNSDGSFTFYTRGVDRVAEKTDELLGNLPYSQSAFEGADKLWTAFQNNLVSYIGARGGKAEKILPTIHRVEWDKIKDILKGKHLYLELGCKRDLVPF